MTIVVNDASNRRPRGPYALLGLVGLSAVFTYYLDSYLNGSITLDEESPASSMGGFKATDQQLARARQLGISKRILDTKGREVWHECMEQSMTAIQCKDFIDEEIWTEFTDEDRFIKSIIVSPRASGDPWYNAVVIDMDDSDMALGANNDGWIEYTFTWEGSGQEATAEQQRAIPPVQLVETDTGAAESQAVTTVLAQQAGNDFEVTSQATEITEPASVQAIVAEAPPVEDDAQTFTTSSPTPSPTPKPTPNPTPLPTAEQAQATTAATTTTVTTTTVTTTTTTTEEIILTSSPTAGPSVTAPAETNQPTVTQGASTNANSGVAGNQVTPSPTNKPTTASPTTANPTAGVASFQAASSQTSNVQVFSENPNEVLDATLFEGATTDDAVRGNNTEPITGGVVLSSSVEDTPEGQERLALALSEPASIAPEGPRTIGPFDCRGLTGTSCCLRIKHEVRDADIYDRAIQCTLGYKETTCKAQWWIESDTSKKVKIYANANEMVREDPMIEGSWPQCEEKFDSTVHDFNEPSASAPEEAATCGKQNGDTSCPEGLCCDAWGTCGSGSAKCGFGCQDDFGFCNAVSDTSGTSGIVTQEKCGAAHDNRACSGTYCCGADGTCGSSANHCEIDNGCQSSCWAPIVEPALALASPAVAAAVVAAEQAIPDVIPQECRGKANVCVALDMSGSVCSPNFNSPTMCTNCAGSCNSGGFDKNTCCSNFNKIKEFAVSVYNWLNHLQYGINRRSVSMVTFSTQASTKVPVGGDYLAGANSLDYSGGLTNHGAAIKECMDSFEPPAGTPTTYCGCAECNQAMWDTLATDPELDGSHTCGARISWMQTSQGHSEEAACAHVASEFPETCMCDPATCPTPNEKANFILLVTDGVATATSSGSYSSSGGVAYGKEQAAVAKADGVMIETLFINPSSAKSSTIAYMNELSTSGAYHDVSDFARMTTVVNDIAHTLACSGDTTAPSARFDAPTSVVSNVVTIDGDPAPQAQPQAASSSTCACSTCTEAALATNTGSWWSKTTCQERIDHNMNNLGKSEEEACNLASNNYGAKCPCTYECDTAVPPPASVICNSDTYSQCSSCTAFSSSELRAMGTSFKWPTSDKRCKKCESGNPGFPCKDDLCKCNP